jgi:copper ion binding protein
MDANEGATTMTSNVVPPPEVAGRPLRETSVGITGMTCAACVRRIERALGKVPGVAAATVNLATERATVQYDPAVADLAKLKSAIEGAGYGVKDETAQLTLPIRGMTCAACVRRIEKALTKVDGVATATVNLATEQASDGRNWSAPSRRRGTASQWSQPLRARTRSTASRRPKPSGKPNCGKCSRSSSSASPPAC